MFGEAADEVVDALGEDIVHSDGVTNTSLRGVFSNAFGKVEGARGPGVASKRPQVWIRNDTVSPAKGDKIFRGAIADFVGTFDFEVVSARPDEEETGASLVLKKI